MIFLSSIAPGTYSNNLSSFAHTKPQEFIQHVWICPNYMMHKWLAHLHKWPIWRFYIHTLSHNVHSTKRERGCWAVEHWISSISSPGGLLVGIPQDMASALVRVRWLRQSCCRRSRVSSLETGWSLCTSCTGSCQKSCIGSLQSNKASNSKVS